MVFSVPLEGGATAAGTSAPQEQPCAYVPSRPSDTRSARVPARSGARGRLHVRASKARATSTLPRSWRERAAARPGL